MSKKNKIVMAPKLRFPEFSNANCWEMTKLSDVLTEHSLKSSGKEVVFSVSVHKGLINQVEHLGRSFSASNTDRYNRVLPGDVVYTKSPTGDFPFGIVKQSRLDRPVIVSPLYGVFTPKTMGLGTLLGAYFESSGNTRIYLEPLIQKGARNTININNKKFLSGELPLPQSDSEQQKIGQFLDSIDRLIKNQARKLNALNTHKKGLIQQIFPIENETIPKLRFPEFKFSGPWVSKKVSDLLIKVSNPVNVDDDLYYREIGIKSHGKGIFHKEPVKGKTLGNKRVFAIEKNAFIVNIVFAWELAIANTSESEEGMIASHRFPMYKPYKNRADVTYIKYFFDRKGKELLWIASPGGAGRNKTLGQKDFERLEFLIPESLIEQQKIADCLSTIDALIDVESNKLKELKRFKKGLIQEMLPVMDDSVQ
uniref:restriction endonuclease subunit S n=1 Tax=Enterobacter cloacae complex sp. TaxID=2027919 RepID=UPI001C0A93BB|nr:restriction endonuclease subunit S [Enterobacter cloacae complex sp.]